MEGKLLWELQEVEQNLLRISREMRQKELLIKLKKIKIKLDELEGYLEKEIFEKIQLEKKIKKLEDEVKYLEEKKEAQEKQLYSGNTSVLKELQSMKEKVEEFNQKIQNLEEEMLLYMDQLEEKISLINQLTTNLEDLKKEYFEGVKEYKEGKLRLEKEKVFEEKKLQKIKNKLSKEILKKYYRFQEKYNNTAIAKIDNGICTGCRIEIPVIQLNSMKKGNNIQCCEYCGRLLVTME